MNSEQTNPLHLSNRFTQAVDYARHLHIECRKGTEIPYMAHLLGVAALVMAEAGHAKVPVTENMCIAAILHDAVEDHGGHARLRDIEHNFGADVARLVAGMSDSFSDDPNNKEPWQERKERYIRRLRKEPADVQLIAAADKLYNARAILEDYRDPGIGTRIWERFRSGRNDQLWYFHSVLQVLEGSNAGRSVKELARVITHLEEVS